jgi:hypothetical protein
MNDFAATFLLFKLYPFLVELNVPESRRDRAIEWYRRESQSWSAGSQVEFDAFATVEVEAFCKNLTRSSDRLSPDRPVDGSDEAAAEALREMVSREQERKQRVARHNERVLAAQPRIESWKPCKFWAGEALCETCLKRLPAGVLAKVNQMFEKHETFVLSRIYAETLGRADEERRKDITNEVWAVVTRKIGDFVPDDNLASQGELAWLRRVTELTVASWFQRLNAMKRGTYITGQLDDELISDRGLPDVSKDGMFALPAKSTKPPIEDEGQ